MPGEQVGLGEYARRRSPLVAVTLLLSAGLVGIYLTGDDAAPARAGAAPRPVAAVPMAAYTTRFTPGEPRVRNIELAARALDGRTVAAGEVVSFNRDVGPRTRRRGYVAAPSIAGDRLVPDVGGGICQVSATLFNAVFEAGLEIRRARAHSLWLPEYPAGREAAVAYPGLDFVWRNDSGAPLTIRTEVTGSSLTVSLWGTRRYTVASHTSKRRHPVPYTRIQDASPRCVPTPGGRGFDVTVRRTLLADTRRVRTEHFSTRYLPRPEVTCARR
ncbi:VanW family protein [Actinomadura flavalba]|uniref:VanW family protein n=1 Tax=Actinomadura flavalba TaxID=1120938 RepID=UPI0003775805|nr:VanW family protein [Actinomadura flavalba]